MSKTTYGLDASLSPSSAPGMVDQKPAQPWSEETFFAEATSRLAPAVDGLRILLEAAQLFRGDLPILWGSGLKEPRFFIRRPGTTSGELLSGWASGEIGIRVEDLRGILGDSAPVLDELNAAVPEIDRSHKEPLFSAAVLRRPRVIAAVVSVLAAIVESADAGTPARDREG